MFRRFLALCLALACGLSACQPQAVPAASTPTIAPAPTATSVPSYPPVPYELLSEESIFGYLEGLTAIQPYSGWRNTGSSGEAEALDYVAGELAQFSYLQNQGLEQERQSYPVFISAEIWETRLQLAVQGQEVEIPVNGLRGNRFNPQLALSLDSDGKSNDSERNPITASGPGIFVRDAATLLALTSSQVEDQILFLDYALVDTAINEAYPAHGQKLMQLINQGLAGVVLVTTFSNVDGESHGSFVGDGGVFQYYDHIARIPIVHARLEDLGPAGIKSWEDLAHVETARVTWDQDVFIPGTSGNLITRLPGRDSSRAIILTAHVDTASTPGVFDDGSGSAILLEIARVLNVSKVQPAVDLYLIWFGGHELYTYGSSHFVATHQDLLDRTLAMLSVDGIGHGLDGKASNITMSFTPYGHYGDERALWPDFLIQNLASSGVTIEKYPTYGTVADNSNFDAFNVPNFNLFNLDNNDWPKGSAYIHYASHWHDPYETVEFAREVSPIFVDAARIALSAALETGRTSSDWRVTPHPERRALFVASHTESATIPCGFLRDLGMALAWEGFDVDLLPYGQPLTAADLEQTDFVVLLPSLDYPGPNSENWSQDEFVLLTQYIEKGGFVLVTNSGYNIAQVRRVEDINEDATDFNAWLKPFGIQFKHGETGGGMIRLTSEHPLSANAKYLTNQQEKLQVFFTQTGGVQLAPGAIGLVDYGSQGGQVLVVSDLGLLKNNEDGAKNLNFVKNIARYARSR